MDKVVDFLIPILKASVFTPSFLSPSTSSIPFMISLLCNIKKDDKKKIINLLTNNDINREDSEEIRIETSEHNTHWVEITLRKFKSQLTTNKVLINLKDISKQKDLESNLSAAQEQFMDKDITESKLAEIL